MTLTARIRGRRGRRRLPLGLLAVLAGLAGAVLVVGLAAWLVRRRAADVTDGQTPDDVALDPGTPAPKTPGADAQTLNEALPASNGVVHELSAIGERA